jgi:ABC-type branched-subunit amino acid transport system substrate-binding protein
MKKLFFVALVVVLMASLILGGCPKPAPTKVLKMGAVIDLSGNRGLQSKNWHNLCAKLINDAGGWKIGNDTYTLEMVIYDTHGSAATAKDALTRAVLQDGCKYILGWSVTGSADVDATITEPNKVIVIAEDLTNQGVNPEYQYYFPVGNFFQNADIYKICKDMVNKGVKSYVSVKPDNQVGRFMDPMINNAWTLADPNINYLGTVWVPGDTVDFGPIATKIKSYNPDCADIIYLGFIPNSIPSTYRALADVGFKGYILPGLMTQAVLDNLVTAIGKETIEGGEVPGADPYTWQQDPSMRSLMDAYVAEYGKWETEGILGSLTSFLVVQAAINGAQSVDTDVVKNYMDNSPAPIQILSGIHQYFARPELGNFRTISGCTSGHLGVIRDGKLVDSGTVVTVKDQYLFTIKTQNMVDAYKAYWAEYGYPTFPAEEKGKESFHYTDLGITGQD